MSINKKFYPYLPDGHIIKYVAANNKFLLEAKRVWSFSGCKKQATGAVVVKDSEVIGKGNNTTLHHVEVCPRDEQGFKTGEGYHLCEEVCLQVSGHSESSAVIDALDDGKNTNDADVYLYGHWWCCENCWNTMISAGIKNIYLLEGAGPETIWK